MRAGWLLVVALCCPVSVWGCGDLHGTPYGDRCSIGEYCQQVDDDDGIFGNVRPSGYYMDLTVHDLTSCKSCPLGKRARCKARENSRCEDCPSGMYQTEYARDHCESCGWPPTASDQQYWCDGTQRHVVASGYYTTGWFFFGFIATRQSKEKGFLDILLQTTLATAAGSDTMVAPAVPCTGHVHANMALPPEPSVGHVPSNTLPLANSLLDTMLLTDGDIGDIAGSDVVVSCAAPSAGRCVPTSTVLSLANLFLDKPSTASGAVTTDPAVPTNAHLPPANSFLGTILASSAVVPDTTALQQALLRNVWTNVLTKPKCVASSPKAQ